MDPKDELTDVVIAHIFPSLSITEIWLVLPLSNRREREDSRIIDEPLVDALV